MSRPALRIAYVNRYAFAHGIANNPPYAITYAAVLALEYAPCLPPLPPLATGPFFYRYGTADHLEWLEPLVVRHDLYIPPAT
jgi:hypothetical protein